MRYSLNSFLKECDSLCLWGGSEDISILKRYGIDIPHVIDIQTELAPIIPYHRKQISLDRICLLSIIKFTLVETLWRYLRIQKHIDTIKSI